MRYLMSATVIVLLLLANQLNAEIYRWVDEVGNVHFSDKAVSKKSEKVEIKLKPTSGETPEIRQQRKKRADQFLRARKEERAEQDKKIREKKVAKQKRKQKCKAAQREYGRMTRARSIFYKGKDGARDYISDDERTKIILAEKAKIDKWCK